ncbi:MAG TPA: RagB/SusD family nutrient uptake outer membrane protein [Petrimonas sp.]|uniref:RagB/SusD family nutrient uptake outer membrane protein n=1 Tax=Petrimonas sp. TaxID=2023866 RepID=UPI0017500C3D|nr:RagB/SusD family nutrient uptake outer membrane protein [Petrimonas sp.]
MRKIKYLIVLTISVIFTSCNNILDIEPKDRITGIWTNEALVESYVHGMYNSLQHGFCEALWGSLTDELHDVHNNGGAWIIQRGELTSDNISTLSTTTTTPSFNKWGYAYARIRDINEFFQQIESSDFEDKIKNRLKGEMKFIRAYLYSELLWRYGDVPLITQVFALDDDYTTVKKESYGKVVDFIVNELDEAAVLLSQSEIKKGRATPDATVALKSRVLLYAASPLNNPSNDLTKWEKAAEAAEALIDKYTLYHDYKNLFLEDNNEIIFGRYFTKSINHNINGLSGANSLYGGGHNHPAENIVMDYEMINGELPYSLDASNNIIANPGSGYDPKNPYLNRDPRFYASILYDGCIFQDHEIETFDGGIDSPLSSVLPWNATMTGYYLYKFIDPSKSVNLRTDDLSTNPWIFFRYGEILLNYAEAKFELGDEDAARKSINLIRARVNMPPVNSSGVDLRNKIRHERRIELAFEGHRFFDVRRWKILEEVSTKQILGMQIRKAQNGDKSYDIKVVAPVAYYEQHLKLPIPRTEIDKSGGALIQNTGY